MNGEAGKEQINALYENMNDEQRVHLLNQHVLTSVRSGGSHNLNELNFNVDSEINSNGKNLLSNFKNQQQQQQQQPQQKQANYPLDYVLSNLAAIAHSSAAATLSAASNPTSRLDFPNRTHLLNAIVNSKLSPSSLSSTSSSSSSSSLSFNASPNNNSKI